MLNMVLGLLMLWQGPANKAEDDTCLRLRNGRFEARMQYRESSDQPFSDARSVSLREETGFDETGYFYIGSDAFIDLAVRIFNGCDFNEHFWVFAASTTKVEYTLTVTDTQTDQSRTYSNELGILPPPIQDTRAFATCPSPDAHSYKGTPAVGAEILRLLERFEMEIDYNIPSEPPGKGTVGFATSNSGYFWFLDQSDPNVYVKIEDKRAVNGHYWFTYTSLTGAEYTLRITDTETGLVRTFFNPAGASSFGRDIFLGEPPSDVIFPWISNNDAFSSDLYLANNNCHPTDVTLSATRADGSTEEIQRTIPAGSFLSESAADLFPMLGDGPGYAVISRGEIGGLRGSWVTNNLNSASGNSPSQGLAIVLPSDIPSPLPPNALVGPNLQYGLVPLRPDSFAGLVTVNLGDTATDVAYYYFDANGKLLRTDEESARDLQPNRPFAFIPTSIDGQDVVSMIARSSNGNPLAGVTFFFNQANEPSIANTIAIDFVPPPK